MPDVRNLLVKGVEKVDATMWTNFIRHTIDEEDRFWKLDIIVEELMAETQEVVMTIGDTSSDESDEDDE